MHPARISGTSDKEDSVWVICRCQICSLSVSQYQISVWKNWSAAIGMVLSGSVWQPDRAGKARGNFCTMKRGNTPCRRPRLCRGPLCSNPTATKVFLPLAAWQQEPQQLTYPAPWGVPCSKGRKHDVLPTLHRSSASKAPLKQERGRLEQHTLPTCMFLLLLSYQPWGSQITVPNSLQPHQTIWVTGSGVLWVEEPTEAGKSEDSPKARGLISCHRKEGGLRISWMLKISSRSLKPTLQEQLICVWATGQASGAQNFHLCSVHVCVSSLSKVMVFPWPV